MSDEKTKTKAKKAKKSGAVVTRGKRKEAIARATLKTGKGRVTINGANVYTLTNALLRDKILEPLSFSDAGGYDIAVSVHGGGANGQAQAARTAIARALVEQTGSEDLRRQLLAWDRSFLVEDPRRVEPKKFKGPGARARFTKSYR